MAATIKTSISLDSSKATAGVTRFKTKLKGLKQTVGGMKGMFVGLFALGGITAFFNKFDRIGKLASRLNTTAESIQRIGFAAELAGSDLEGIVNALTRVTRKATDLKNIALADAFKGLGIEQAKFIDADLEGKLQLLADSFVNAESEGDAFRHLFTLLEDDAKNLIPLLREGGDGIAAMMDKAAVASNRQVKQIEKLKDVWTEVKNKAGVAIFWIIDKIERLGVRVAVVVDRMNAAFTSTGEVIQAVLSADMQGVKDALNGHADALKRIRNVQKEILDADPISDALNADKDGKSSAADTAKKIEKARVDKSGLDFENETMAQFRKNHTERFNKNKEAEKAKEKDAGVTEKARGELRLRLLKQDRKDAESNRDAGFAAAIGSTNESLGKSISQRDSANPFSVTASSLASIGGGGRAVGVVNPQLKKLDRQIVLLELQLEHLEALRDGGPQTLN